MKTAFLVVAALLVASAVAVDEQEEEAQFDFSEENGPDLSNLDLEDTDDASAHTAAHVSHDGDSDDDEMMPTGGGGGACYRDCASVMKSEWNAMRSAFKACRAKVHAVARGCHEATVKAFAACKHSREFKDCVNLLNKSASKCKASRKKALKHKCHAVKNAKKKAIAATNKTCKNKCCHNACAAWSVKCNKRKCRATCCASAFTKCKADCGKATEATEATATMEDLDAMDGTEGESEVEVEGAKCFNRCQGTLSSTFRSLTADHRKCKGTPRGVHRKCLSAAQKESSKCHGSATKTHRNCAQSSRRSYAKCIRGPVKDHRLCHCKCKNRKCREACAKTKKKAVDSCKRTRSSSNRECENTVSAARKKCQQAQHKAHKKCYGARDKSYEKCLNDLRSGQHKARKASVRCKKGCCHSHCKAKQKHKYGKGPKCMRACYDETKVKCDKSCKRTYNVKNVRGEADLDVADSDSADDGSDESD